MKKKKHRPSEIEEKMALADRLFGEGKTQRDVAKTLGISVVTYHRWRKQRLAMPQVSLGSVVPAAAPGTIQIRDLHDENRRLRELVADLLLEKTRLEEVLARRSSSRAA